MKNYSALTTIGAPGAPLAVAGDDILLDDADASALLAIGAIEGGAAVTVRQPAPEPTSVPAAANPLTTPKPPKPPKPPKAAAKSG